MIKTIQLETKGAIAAMEEGVKEVENGTREAAKSDDALQDILQDDAVVVQVNQIAAAAEQQTATTSEIADNIHQMTEILRENDRVAQESATAAHDLNDLAEELQRVVDQFTLAA